MCQPRERARVEMSKGALLLRRHALALSSCMLALTSKNVVAQRQIVAGLSAGGLKDG